MNTTTKKTALPNTGNHVIGSVTTPKDIEGGKHAIFDFVKNRIPSANISAN